MKRIGMKVSMLVLVSSLASSALAAQDGVLLKEQLADTNYCHMKFPAIRPSTLGGSNPQLKSPDTNDVIDFYGPCDESPIGPDQVLAQRNFLDRHTGNGPHNDD